MSSCKGGTADTFGLLQSNCQLNSSVSTDRSTLLVSQVDEPDAHVIANSLTNVSGQGGKGRVVYQIISRQAR